MKKSSNDLTEDSEATSTQSNSESLDSTIPMRKPSGPDFDILSILKDSAKIAVRVLTRQVIEQTDGVAPPPPASPPDPILEILKELVDKFKSGESTENVKAEIVKLISHQGERHELINNLLVMHDLDRLPAYLKARHLIEQYLLTCADRKDLSPIEALAFFKIAQTEIETITSRVRIGATPVKDVEALVEKADFVTRLSETELQRKFQSTTPQGREILRKVGYRLAKLAQDKTS